MLLWKALALPVVASLLVSATPAQEPLSFTQYPLVKQVVCFEGKGAAFRVGQNHLLSVAHVTAMHDCQIDGLPITVTEQDGKHDFSKLDMPIGVPNGIRISCEGYRPGEWVWASGYAFGIPVQTAIAVYATYAKTPDGKRILIGPRNFIPGMSGGPVLNSRGEVVGLVNAFLPGTPLSFSRELRDTSVCQARDQAHEHSGG